MPAYKDAERGTWYVKFRYKDWNGKMRYATKRGFAKRRDALDYEQNFKTEKAGKPNILFKDFVNIFYTDKNKRIRETSMINKRNIVDSKLLPFFGEYKLDEITPAMIRQWQSAIIERNYSQSYTRSINVAMRSLFKFAEKYYGMSNPARNSDPIGTEKPKNEMLFWTKEEFGKVTNVMVTRHYCSEVALKILFWTGMRSGELLALTLNDIDFAEKTISITKTYARVRGEDRIHPPKTPRSRRKITVSDSLLEVIQEYVNKLYDYQPTDRLFPYTIDFLRYSMNTYSKKAGVKRIRLHDLRHSHASLLIDMGVDILLISQRLGHESVQTTLDTYSHLYPDKQKQVADLLDGLVREDKNGL